MRCLTTCMVCVLTLFFYAHPLHSESPSPTQDVEGPLHSFPEEFDNLDAHDSHFMTQFFQMLKVLGLIVLGMFLVSWLLKRMMNTRSEQLNVSSAIKVIERRALTPKSILYLVEIQGKQFVIADSVNGISYLGDIPSLHQGKKFSELLDKSTEE